MTLQLTQPGARHVTYNLGSVSLIPLGEGRAFQVGGRRVAVFRLRTGDLHAVQAECPHAGGPLADGLIGGARVVCPLHGRVFDLESGRELRDECPALVRYHVRVTGSGNVLLDVPEEQR